jgi:hypothetical protein
MYQTYVVIVILTQHSSIVSNTPAYYTKVTLTQIKLNNILSVWAILINDMYQTYMVIVTLIQQSSIVSNTPAYFMKA